MTLKLSPEDRTRASLNVLALDRSYNPCSPDKSQNAPLPKTQLFKCVAGVSYANTRSFAPYRDRLLSFIAKAEGNYLHKLAALETEDGPEVEGMTAALRAKASPYGIHLSGAANRGRVSVSVCNGSCGPLQSRIVIMHVQA